MAQPALQPKCPDHVPPHLFWDHHWVEFAGELADPFLSGARLHQGPPIVYARDVGYGRSGWIVTRYALQEEVFLDPQRFSSAGIMGLNEMLGVSWPMIPIELDPPAHAAYRQILNALFSPRVVKEMQEDVRATCRALPGADTR